jgi:hypothetical protein
MSAKHPESVPANGTEIFVALNKLKKSPKNARKVPHSEAAIESYAASIDAKGILQTLVVEPELDADGKPTGYYLVTIGEGRRLAQLLRARSTIPVAVRFSFAFVIVAFVIPISASSTVPCRFQRQPSSDMKRPERSRLWVRA